MRKLFVLLFVLSLGGCASNFQNAWNTLTGAKLSPTAVYVAINTVDSAEIIATAYLRACHKSPSAYAACAKPVESQVVSAVRSVRSARNDLRAFMVAHPDALGASGLFDALTQAQKTLSSIENNYNLAQVQ